MMRANGKKHEPHPSPHHRAGGSEHDPGQPVGHFRQRRQRQYAGLCRRRAINQVEVSAGGDSGSSVEAKGINRNLNTLLQSQLWTETSGGSYADTKSQLYQQLQQVYGTPGTAGAFDTAFNNFAWRCSP